MNAMTEFSTAFLADDDGRGLDRFDGLGDFGGRNGGVIALVLIALAVAAVITLVIVWSRSRGNKQAVFSPSSTASGALEILEQRFARGEIDADEFAARRAVLNGETMAPPSGDAMESPAVPVAEDASAVDESEESPEADTTGEDEA